LDLVVVPAHLLVVPLVLLFYSKHVDSAAIFVVVHDYQELNLCFCYQLASVKNCKNLCNNGILLLLLVLLVTNLLLLQIIISNILPLLNITKMVKTLEQATNITLVAIERFRLMKRDIHAHKGSSFCWTQTFVPLLSRGITNKNTFDGSMI
jgi:hypothetical protein